MALPDATDVVFFAVMYPQMLPQFLEEALDASQRAADLLTNAGGKRYVADWRRPKRDRLACALRVTP